MSDAPSNARAVPVPGDRDLRVVDYEQTVAVINVLTEVRFKLAVFIPPVTGAAVALLATNDIKPFPQMMIGLGGLIIVLGIVLYDLRNSQLYNGAIRRATQLERLLFESFDGDSLPGLFGFHADSTHRRRGTSTPFSLGASPGTGLALVYAATLAGWVWVVFDAIAIRVEISRRWTGQPGEWIQGGNHASWLAAAATGVVALMFFVAYRRQDQAEAHEVASSET